MAKTLYFINVARGAYVEVPDVNGEVTVDTFTIKSEPYNKEFSTRFKFPMQMAFSADYGKPMAGEMEVPALIDSINLKTEQQTPSSTTNQFTITPTLGDKADRADLTQAQRQDDIEVSFWKIPVIVDATGPDYRYLNFADWPSGFSDTAPVF